MLLTIEKLVYGGDGLARLPADEHGRGKAVFVPFVLEGEKIEASLLEQKRGFARGRAEQILEPSPYRIEPRCPYFGRCGGCQYQHTSYEHQLEIKAAILKENLRRIAKLELETELIIHPSSAWHYRNRARLKVQTAPDFALGYYKFNSHELLPVEECPISSPLINRAIAALWQMGRAGNAPKGMEEIEFFVNADDTQLLIEAHSAVGTNIPGDWAQTLQGTLPEIVGVASFTAETATHAAKPAAVWGAGELTYKTDRAAYRVSAGAFFQVNRFLTNELVRIVTEGASGRTAVDLYAGVGLFSSVLARNFAQVTAVESSPTSHADLLYNSPSNVKATLAPVEQFLANAAGRLKPELVVVDPPRSGLGERVIRSLVGLEAARLTYVSCDPATLSRDLAGLLASGYRIEHARLLDLFPQTYHLESVFHLVR